jgi:hypothetical protein
MARVPVTSSNVAAIGYDHATLTLEIVYQPDRKGDRRVYAYVDVPADVHFDLMRSPSIGRAVNAIKRAYECRLVATIDAAGNEMPTMELEETVREAMVADGYADVQLSGAARNWYTTKPVPSDKRLAREAFRAELDGDDA